MRLAREFRRADWRRMLSEMSATELGEWGDYFRMQSFSDVWMDAQFASLKALIVRMVSGSSDAAVADFSLLPEENGMLTIWRELRCLIFIVRMTGGVTVRISIWIIWRQRGCIRCRCQRRSRAMCCCAVLVHRCRIMPPFTAATASCCTIFLNN